MSTDAVAKLHKYKISWTETIRKAISVDASTPNEAVHLVQSRQYSGLPVNQSTPDLSGFRAEEFKITKRGLQHLGFVEIDK